MLFAMRNACVSLNDTFDQKIQTNQEARILTERIKSLARLSSVFYKCTSTPSRRYRRRKSHFRKKLINFISYFIQCQAHDTFIGYRNLSSCPDSPYQYITMRAPFIILEISVLYYIMVVFFDLCEIMRQRLYFVFPRGDPARV